MIQNMVSVIIPTWNRKKDLISCLNSIMEQDYRPIEIIVIDNNSSDGTAKLIKEKFPTIKLILNNRNLGASMAKNQGALLARGEYVWFLDSDTEILNKTCLSTMLCLLQSSPKIGAIGGEIYIVDNGRTQMRRKILTEGGRTLTVPIRFDEAKFYGCDFLATSNCLMPKKLIFELGGFDPKYFFLGEDADIGYKIRKRGLKNIIDYRTAVMHKISERRASLYRMHRNSVRFILLNLSLPKILFLPFFEIKYLLYKNHAVNLKNQDINILRHLSPAMKRVILDSNSFLLKLSLVGTVYLSSLIWAYLWNIFFLPETIYIRFKRPNFLKSNKIIIAQVS